MGMATDGDNSLEEWIEHVFDHPVTNPAWHWEPDSPRWQGSSEQIASHIAETFERSGQVLACFSDEQLNQGFWFLVNSSCSGYMYSIVDPGVPFSLRIRALRSFVLLFEQIMAVRCSGHLSHLDEQGANDLNSACYMWWDILPIDGCPQETTRAEFDAEVLVVLKQLLVIPQDACRESTLHGLGHWSIHYPSVAGIIDEFLSSTPNLRPELIAYAKRAKTGAVL